MAMTSDKLSFRGNARGVWLLASALALMQAFALARATTTVPTPAHAPTPPLTNGSVEQASSAPTSPPTPAKPIASAAKFSTEKFIVDNAQTRATYETRYLGVIPVRGRFDNLSGSLHYRFERPIAEREAAIQVSIDAKSLRPTTFDNEDKRAMIRGPEFFNVEKFPTIEFRSTQFRYEADKLIAIDGTLTLVGVTKPVTLRVNKSGCEPATTERPARCTASTFLNVKRFEFGMRGWEKTVSDEVRIAVEFVAVAVPMNAVLQPSVPPPNGTKPDSVAQ
jgi:polyisoprenoid-binding protein YceI